VYGFIPKPAGSGGGTLLYNIADQLKGRDCLLIGIDFSITAIKQAKNFVPCANFLCAKLLKTVKEGKLRFGPEHDDHRARG
jgi:hypothetical protein